MKFKQTFVQFDLLAPPVAMLVYGRRSFPTVRGAILSILAVLLSMLFVAQVIYDFFNYTNPKISSNKISLPKAGDFDMLKGNLFPVLIIGDSRGYDISIDKVSNYFEFNTNFVEYKEQVKAPSVKVNMISCKQLKTSLNAKGKMAYFEGPSLKVADPHMKSILEAGICIDTETLNTSTTVFGLLDNDPNYRFFEIKINPCSNSNCVSKNEMLATLVNVLRFDAVVNLNEYMNPITYQSRIDLVLSPHPTSSLTYSNRLSNLQIRNSRPDFFLTESVQTNISVSSGYQSTLYNRDYTSFDCSADPASCSVYYILQYECLSDAVIYGRTYLGVVDALGSIGGICSLIFTIIGGVHAFVVYKLQLMQKSLARRVYGISFESMKTIYCCKKQSNKSKTESLGPNEGSSAESTKPETNMNGFTAAQQAGLDLVESSMDIHMIMKELNLLRMIFEMLVKDSRSLEITDANQKALELKIKENRRTPNQNNKDLISETELIPLEGPPNNGQDNLPLKSPSPQPPAKSPGFDPTAVDKGPPNANLSKAKQDIELDENIDIRTSHRPKIP